MTAVSAALRRYRMDMSEGRSYARLPRKNMDELTLGRGGAGSSRQCRTYLGFTGVSNGDIMEQWILDD